MGKAPNVKLKNMPMQERIEWFRKQLLDMAGTEEVHQGKRWWVLEYQGGLCNLLQELSGGILSKSVYNDINNQMMRNGLRTSYPAGAGGHNFVHRVLMLEQAAPADNADAGQTPAGTQTSPAADLKAGGEAMRWAAKEIAFLRSKVETLEKQYGEVVARNAELRTRVAELEQAAEQVVATPAATQLFHDGLSGLNRMRGTSS